MQTNLGASLGGKGFSRSLAWGLLQNATKKGAEKQQECEKKS